MAVAAARHLKDLRNPELGALLRVVESKTDGETVQPEAPAEVPRRPDRGYDKGYADAKAESQAQHLNDIAALEADFAERLAEERRQWAEQTAGELACQFKAQAETLGETICAMLRQRAEPVMSELMRRGAIEQMGRLVQRMLEEAVLVRVSGPAALLTALRGVLGDDGDKVRLSESSETELRLKAGPTQAQTCIDHWLAQWQDQDTAHE